MRYALKAFPEVEQLADRRDKLAAAGLPPLVELHLGDADLSDRAVAGRMAEACRAAGAEYIVHVPLIDGDGRLLDLLDESHTRIERTLELADAVESGEVVVHYGAGYYTRAPVADIRRTARERLRGYAVARPDLTFYVENYGPVWLPGAGGGRRFYQGPLDHFWPWEAVDFLAWARREGLENVRLLLDLAHAALSANMFNLLKQHSQLSTDVRFSNIMEGDLERMERLDVLDFAAAVPYGAVHVSDALVWGTRGPYNPDVDSYLTSEGLSLGEGGINLSGCLSAVVAGPDEPLIVLEILEHDYRNALRQQAGLMTCLRLAESIRATLKPGVSVKPASWGARAEGGVL